MDYRSAANARANYTNVLRVVTSCRKWETLPWSGWRSCSSILVRTLDWDVQLRICYLAKILTSQPALSVRTSVFFVRVRGLVSSRRWCLTCDPRIRFASWKEAARKSTLNSILLLCFTLTGQSHVSGGFSVLTFSSTSPTPCFTLRLITRVDVEKALRIRRVRPLPVVTPSPISLTQWRWMDRWVDGLRTLVKCTRNRRGRVSCATLKTVSAFVEISWNISLATGAANCASTSSWNNWRNLPTIFKKINSTFLRHYLPVIFFICLMGNEKKIEFVEKWNHKEEYFSFCAFFSVSSTKKKNKEKLCISPGQNRVCIHRHFVFILSLSSTFSVSIRGRLNLDVFFLFVCSHGLATIFVILGTQE